MNIFASYYKKYQQIVDNRLNNDYNRDKEYNYLNTQKYSIGEGLWNSNEKYG